MWFLIVFLCVMGVAGLFYPRRPLLTAMLFIMLGASLLAVWAVGWITGSLSGILFASAIWIGFGLGALSKFRNSAVRSAHVAEWTGKA
jgi:hypothetical protein